MRDYDDDTIAAIEQEYNRGEYSDLDDDPEAEARARSREEQEQLDRDRRRARGSRRLAEVAFTPAALNLGDGRTLADNELEGYAQATGHRAEPWTGPTGPMAIPEVRDEPKRFAALIEAWERDPTGYLAELKRRGLVR